MKMLKKVFCKRKYYTLVSFFETNFLLSCTMLNVRNFKKNKAICTFLKYKLGKTKIILKIYQYRIKVEL